MPKTTKTDSFSARNFYSELQTKNEVQRRQKKGDTPYRVQPVDIQTFVTSQDYLGISSFGGLSPLQLKFVEKASDFDNGIEVIVGLLGKGSGKNFVVSVTYAYVLYKLLCMFDCHTFFNHPRTKHITLLNVSSSRTQANDNFFSPLCILIMGAGSKAFKDLGFTPKVGTNIFSDEILLENELIRVKSGSSERAGIEGYDLLLGVADECDDEDFHSASKLINTLNSSRSSRFPQGQGKTIIISYKRFEGSSGKIEEYYNRYKGDPASYCLRAATWEFNPSKKQEMFASDFRTEPERSAMELGSEESNVLISSWIKDPQRIRNSFSDNEEWIFMFEPPVKDWNTGENKATSETRVFNNITNEFEELDPYNLKIKPCNKDTNYIFIGDPGEGNDLNGGDAFGITLGHRELVEVEVVESRKQQADGSILEVKKIYKYPKVVVDFSFRFTGRMFPEKQIQFSAVENLIDRLNYLGYNIRLFSFDGWNSTQLSQNITKKYPESIIHNRNLVTDEDYAELKAAISTQANPTSGGIKDIGGGITMPFHPILFWELENLVIDKKGKVNHRPSTSKDMTDPLAKLCYICRKNYPFGDLLISAGKHTQTEKPENLNGEKSYEDYTHNEKLLSNIFGLGNRFAEHGENKNPKPFEIKNNYVVDLSGQ